MSRAVSSGVPARWLFLGVTALVFLSRLPFLGPGYGLDPDAWRVAATARSIALIGRYSASRFPGYPIPELLDSLLWRGGPLLLNGLTALLGAFAAGLFALTLRRLGCREAWLGALALAFTPVIAVNSACSMDYVWALAFLLGALEAARTRRPTPAGALVGLAAGCRITSALLLLPLSLLVWERAGGRRSAARLARFWIAAAVVGAAAFTPVFLTYGSRFLRGYEHGYPPLLYVTKNATVDVWGIPGSIAVAVATLIALSRVGGWHREGAAPGSDLGRTRAGAAVPGAGGGRARTAWALAILLEFLLFLRLPHEAAYLVPAVPFVLLLLGSLLGRRQFIALCSLLVVSSLVLKASEPGKPDSPRFSVGSVRLGAGGRALTLDVLQGPLLTEHSRRVEGVRYLDRVLEASAALSGRSVVIAYEWLPRIRVVLGSDSRAMVEFVYLLDARKLDQCRAQGRAVYYLPGAEEESRRVLGVSLREWGARPLRVTGG